MHTHTHTHTHIKLRDRKRSLNVKNDHNALWPYRNSYNVKLRVVAVFKEPQRVVACEDMAWCEIRVVAVKGNDHEFGCGSCGSYSEESEGFGLKVTCNLCVRNNWINTEGQGSKSGQEKKKLDKWFFSLQLKTSSSWYWDKRCGRGAWTWSRTTRPQKCPSSRRWYQLLWDLSVEHEGRSTWAAVWWQWIHNCWQQSHQDTWCALKFTMSSVSLNDKVWK